MEFLAETAPPNSLVLVMGSATGDIPDNFGETLIVATDSCIAVGCQAEDDGPTRFWLGRNEELSLDGAPSFTRNLDTPDGYVAIRTIMGDDIARIEVSDKSTFISVWVNHPQEPDEVKIGIG